MTGTWQGKTHPDDPDTGDEHGRKESAEDKKSVTVEKEADYEMENTGADGRVEKKAAWLLMKLSVNDGESGIESGRDFEDDEKQSLEGPRIKRRRATSL